MSIVVRENLDKSVFLFDTQEKKISLHPWVANEWKTISIPNALIIDAGVARKPVTQKTVNGQIYIRPKPTSSLIKEINDISQIHVRLFCHTMLQPNQLRFFAGDNVRNTVSTMAIDLPKVIAAINAGVTPLVPITTAINQHLHKLPELVSSSSPVMNYQVRRLTTEVSLFEYNPFYQTAGSYIAVGKTRNPTTNDFTANPSDLASVAMLNVPQYISSLPPVLSPADTTVEEYNHHGQIRLTGTLLTDSPQTFSNAYKVRLSMTAEFLLLPRGVAAKTVTPEITTR